MWEADGEGRRIQQKEFVFIRRHHQATTAYILYYNLFSTTNNHQVTKENNKQQQTHLNERLPRVRIFSPSSNQSPSPFNSSTPSRHKGCGVRESKERSILSIQQANRNADLRSRRNINTSQSANNREGGLAAIILITWNWSC